MNISKHKTYHEPCEITQTIKVTVVLHLGLGFFGSGSHTSYRPITETTTHRGLCDIIPNLRWLFISSISLPITIEMVHGHEEFRDPPMREGTHNDEGDKPWSLSQTVNPYMVQQFVMLYATNFKLFIWCYRPSPS